jgi:hypothetical protein
MIRRALLLLVLGSPALAQEFGLTKWSSIYRVFSHPRCANCHVGPDNVPIWSGPSYGPKPRPHGMNVNGGASRIGAESIACTSCHTQHNSQLPHGPAGAHDSHGAPRWQLPPVEMQWFGKTSAEVCAQIKDPARNGKRTIADVAKHIEDDMLVHWGWDPGSGRERAPYSVAELVDFLKRWDAAGAPCPAE